MCERELETKQRLQHLDLPSPSGHRRVSFSFSWAAQPGACGPSLSGTYSHSSLLSQTGLQTCWGSRGPLLLGSGFLYHKLSLTHLISNSDFLSPPSYIIINRPLNLWNGMFDRHQAEITVMLFTGHSLPVHQSMLVPWDFTLSHIISQVHLRDFFS